MEMHQVRYFLAVARTLNFTRAAGECNVTQPSLTRSIQKLEDEFGGLLFRRERALTHLTDLGREMLPHLQRTYDAAQAAKSLAKQIGKAQVAPLSLGLSDTVHATQIGELIGEVASTLSGFELSLRTGSSADILAAALSGDIDVVIVEQPQDSPERLEAWELYRRDYVVVMRDDNALAAANGLQVGDLDRASWIERTHDDELRFKSFCDDAGVTPNFSHKVESDVHIHQLVLAGLGCALLPDDMVLGPRLVSRRILDRDVSKVIILGTIAGRYRSGPVDAFIRAARARSWAGPVAI